MIDMDEKDLANTIIVKNLITTQQEINLHQIYILALIVIFSAIGLYVLVNTLNKAIDYNKSLGECKCSNEHEDSSCKISYCHKLKEHDFKYCLTVLFLIIVFICTLTLGNDGKVMEYISFAGTISSLILSVLAIIMTMLAEYKNEGTKASIDSSLQAIKDTADDIKGYKNYIGDVKRRVDKSLENIENINEHIENYNDKLNNLSLKLTEANKTIEEIRKIVPVINQLANKQADDIEIIDRQINEITDKKGNNISNNDIDFSKIKKQRR